ncbi:hypothetical protein [Bdellovibrio sp. HCB337]|uniref:hypothetical protein n=1 Tax=Bdellovibrio sp. HCB337 TaxID=3394358 RepID=UPI0039A73370
MIAYILIFLMPLKANASVAHWEIETRGRERFSLNDESSKKDGEMYSLSFSRGHNELMKLPVRKKTWLLWRTELSNISQSSLENGSCLSPITFSIKKQNQAPLTKRVCFRETSSETAQLEKLLNKFNGYLYGK